MPTARMCGGGGGVVVLRWHKAKPFAQVDGLPVLFRGRTRSSVEDLVMDRCDLPATVEGLPRMAGGDSARAASRSRAMRMKATEVHMRRVACSNVSPWFSPVNRLSRRPVLSKLINSNFGYKPNTEENARTAEATFSTLRDMPEAPATFLSVDVCDVIGQA